MHSWAVIDGEYRYWLARTWSNDLPPVTFVMLNPSTADGTYDDPTIRRCIGFAREWGYGGIVVVNLFAYRATYPRELSIVPDPVGPDNDAYIEMAACHRTVVAWGAQKTHGRDLHVATLLTDPLCLGRTKRGAPLHPLFVPHGTPLIPWRQHA
jgi:hypothetical protein